MTQARIGIIGCGVIGRMHQRFASEAEHIDLVAIADVVPEAAAAAAEQFNPRKVYHAADALLADDEIDGVVLAMPTVHRFDLARQAFAAGKHVLTEKPVALNSAQVEELLAAKGDRLAGCCSSRHRFLESAIEATKFVASGKLGAIRLVRCRGIGAAGKAPEKSPPPWRVSRSLNGGGIFVNWGCYDLDYLLGVCAWSLKPASVFAQCWPVADHLSARVAEGSDAESHVVALVRFESGAMLSIERGEFVAARGDGQWEIIGDRGSLILRLTPGQGNQLVHVDSDAENGVSETVLWEGDESWDTLHRGVIEDFGHALIESRPPATTLEQALVVQRITDAVYNSAARGELIDLTTTP